MRPPGERPELPREEALRAFEEQAEELGLRLDDPSRSSRDIGAVFFAARRITEVAQDRKVRVLAEQHDEAIRNLLEGWERLSPEDRRKKWRDFVTKPLIGVGRGFIGEFDQASFDRWAEDAELRQRYYPHGSGGDVSIEDLRITYSGPWTAVASYRIEYPDSAENGGALLLNTDEGWRIAAALAPGPEEDERGKPE